MLQYMKKGYYIKLASKQFSAGIIMCINVKAIRFLRIIGPRCRDLDTLDLPLFFLSQIRKFPLSTTKVKQKAFRFFKKIYLPEHSVIFPVQYFIKNAVTIFNNFVYVVCV